MLEKALTRLALPADLATIQVLFRSRLGRNIFFNVASLLSPMALTFISSPILVSLLGSSIFGYWLTFRAVVGFTNIMGLNVASGLEQRIPALLAENAYPEIRGVISLGIVFYGVLLLGISIITTIFFGPLSQLLQAIFPPSLSSWAVLLLAVAFWFVALSAGGLSVIRAFQWYRWVAILKTTQSLTLFGLSMLAGLTSPTFLSMMVVTTITAIIDSVIVCGACLWLLKREGIDVRFAPSRKYLKSMLSFSAAGTLSSLGSQLFSTLDKVIVNLVLGPAAVTLYSLAILIPTQLLTLSGAVSATLMPSISYAWSARLMNKVWQQLVYVTLLLAILVGIASLALFIGAELLLQLWLPNVVSPELITSFRIFIIVYFGIGMIAPAHFVTIATGHPWVTALATLVGGTATLVSIAVLAGQHGQLGVAVGNFAYWVNFALVLFAVITVKRAASTSAPSQS
jgi:O-antigen/teichoic acid export membrane protein